MKKLLINLRGFLGYDPPNNGPIPEADLSRIDRMLSEALVRIYDHNGACTLIGSNTDTISENCGWAYGANINAQIFLLAVHGHTGWNSRIDRRMDEAKAALMGARTPEENYACARHAAAVAAELIDSPAPESGTFVLKKYGRKPLSHLDGATAEDVKTNPKNWAVLTIPE